MNYKYLTTLLYVAAIAGCSSWRMAMHKAFPSPAAARLATAEPAEHHAEPPAEGDDHSRIHDLEQAAQDLIGRGMTRPAGDLIKQLRRRQCTIQLPAPSDRKMTPSEIYDRYKPSVLIVAGIYKCEKCGRDHAGPAGGFLITADGAFVTNYHVVNNPKNRTLVAMTDEGKVFPVKEVLAAGKEDDVAILRLDAADAVFKPAVLSTEAPVGAHVSVISHPDRRFYTLTDGIVSRYSTSTVGGKKTSVMMITADFARGSSGGPVFNDCGAVVGYVGSTVSVYYNVDKGRKDNLQMVFKQCIPTGNVLKLIKR